MNECTEIIKLLQGISGTVFVIGSIVAVLVGMKIMDYIHK